MRISELSGASEVPIPTIKYYLREGLLPPGRPTAPNQADYDEDHLRRLRLIRVLIEVGGLGLATVGAVIAAIDDESLPFHEVLGVAHRAVSPAPEGAPPEETREIDDLVEELGWKVSPTAPARRQLAQALSALRRLGWDVTADNFAPYAHAVVDLAAREVEIVGGEASKTDAVERLVIGTVVFERVLGALRRLAQEHHSARRFLSENAVNY